MNLERFDLNLLVALEALMRSGSVTTASQELALTQSAVSSALKRARLHFEDEILFYDGHRMVPTPFGRSLEPVVSDMIASLRGVSRMRAGTGLANMKRQFSIIASDYVAIVFLAELSRQLEVVAPGVSLSIVPFTNDAVGQFNRGTIDFMIGPTFAMEDKIEFEPLFEDRFDCVLSRDNPILQTGLTKEGFYGSPHVVTNFFLDNGQSHFERWLHKQGKPIQVAAALPSFVILPYYVARTRNIATIHRRLVPYFANVEDLVFVEPPVDVPILREFLFTKEQLTFDTEARLIKEFMLQVGSTLQSTTPPQLGLANPH